MGHKDDAHMDEQADRRKVQKVGKRKTEIKNEKEGKSGMNEMYRITGSSVPVTETNLLEHIGEVIRITEVSIKSER